MTAKKNKTATTLNLSPSFEGDESRLRRDGGGNKQQTTSGDTEGVQQPAETPESSIQNPVSFYTRRIVNELAITPELNKIRLKFDDDETKTTREIEHQIFSEDEAGNIRILPFNINRELIQFDSTKATPTVRNIENSRRKTYYVTRLREPETFTDKKGNQQVKKYNFPKGAETVPFITPGLCDKFERAQKIETLVLTEGYFKAFKGYMNGLDIVGLSSISHYREKDTQTMYTDVLQIINRCHVENIIILYDGDARNISLKDLERKQELRRRPLQFINSARTIRELLKDINVDIYFACVNSDEIKNKPKGLDDLYIELPADAENITRDITAFSRPPQFFHRFPIRFDLGKLYKFFCLDTVENFRALHAGPIGNRDFVYNGTTYCYNPDTGNCDVKTPGASKNYFRVGDDYFKFVEIPNKYQQNEKKFVRRLKTTIESDHPTPKGKAPFISFIPKYEAFCNVPDHVNYQQVINSCFNIYAPFEFEPEEGNFDTILAFIKHIFQEQFELGLDYVQLLYQRPFQTMPILCLVSKENNTGKSTFIKFIKAIFGQNVTVIGNEDLGNGFNAFWVAKLVIGIEETLIDKKPVTERIKSLATADKITMNAKGRDQVEIDFFGKFILASNNEDTFIYASAEDIRYWVRKVPVIPQETMNIRMMEDMIEEIPAFLHFLSQRQMHTKNESRMWFNPKLLKTEALEKLIHNSRPGIEKEIYEYLKSIFLEFGETEVHLTPTNANDLFLKRKQDVSYLSRIFRENLKAQPYTNADGKEVVKSYSIPYWGLDESSEMIRKEHRFKGRPYVFEAAKILDPADLKIWRELQSRIDGTPPPPPQPDNDIPEEYQKDLPF